MLSYNISCSSERMSRQEKLLGLQLRQESVSSSR